MSASQQALVAAVAADIAKALGASLQTNPEILETIGQLTKGNLPKFESLGKDFAMQVIGDWRSDNQGTRHPLTRQEVTASVIAWFSSELSQQISGSIVDYTINGVTRQRLNSSSDVEIVDGSIVFDKPFTAEMVTTFAIGYGGAPAMSLSITVDVDAELTVNDALTKLESKPVRRIEEIDLVDCVADVEVTGPKGAKIADFKASIKGKIIL